MRGWAIAGSRQKACDSPGSHAIPDVDFVLDVTDLLKTRFFELTPGWELRDIGAEEDFFALNPCHSFQVATWLGRAS